MAWRSAFVAAAFAVALAPAQSPTFGVGRAPSADLARLPAELRRIWQQGKVLPQPVQRPIPIWMGYQNARGARRAMARTELQEATLPR